MDIRKKQLILYTMFLLVLVGSVTFAFSGKPEDLGSIWERIWKIQGESKTIVIWEGELLEPDSSIFSDDIDLRGYKTIHIHYFESGPASHRDNVYMVGSWRIEGETDVLTSPGPYVPDVIVVSSDVKGPYISFRVTHGGSSGDPSYEIFAYIYATTN